MPQLLQQIIDDWVVSDFCMKNSRCGAKSSNHPTCIQAAIANVDPPETHAIVQNKKSRFE